MSDNYSLGSKMTNPHIVGSVSTWSAGGIPLSSPASPDSFLSIEPIVTTIVIAPFPTTPLGVPRLPFRALCIPTGYGTPFQTKEA